MGKAVDEVRRREHRRLMEQGDESLKKTKFLWLFHPDNLGEERLLRFEELVELNLATVEAYDHRLQLLEFWQPDARRAAAHFERWLHEDVASALERVARTERTLRDNFAGLISWFTHRATNAAAEAFNGRIQAIKANARGFRAFENYRTSILFHLGKLDLKPL